MLKKTLLAVFIVLLAQVSFAAEGPFSKGSAKIGGNIMLSKQGGDIYTDNFRMILEPTISFFIVDKFNLGGYLALDYINIGGHSDYSNTDWILGTVYGYYFTNTSDGFNFKSKVVPYFSGSIGFSREDSITQIRIGNSLGIDYMVSNSVGIDFSANILIDRLSYSGVSASGYTLFLGIGVDSFIF